jgi:hypothetical protein
MLRDRESEHSDTQYQPSRVIDAMACDGLDPTAGWRMHMREQTMARQAAERRYAKSARVIGNDGHALNGDVQPRGVEYRAELARISAEHWAWLREHYGDVADRPLRKRRTSVAAQQ